MDYKNLANPGVQNLHPYTPGKPIEEVQRELGLTEVAKLASNENTLGPSPKAQAAVKAVAENMSYYPDGSGYELKHLLASELNVNMDQITLGNGSNELLEVIPHAFLAKEQNAVYSQYAFIIYANIVQAIGAKGIEVPAQDWGHDLDAMAAAVNDETKLVFVANPNNPSGTWHDKDAIKAFLDKIPEHVIVILDEAYFEYVDSSQNPDGVSLLGDYPNLIVTRTFSKAYGLAGLRVGYAVSSPEIADMLNRVRAPFNVNIMAQAAAIATYQDKEYLQRVRQSNDAGMTQICEGIKALGFDYIPSVANFVCLDVGHDAMAAYDSMLHDGVIVRPIGPYGMVNHLRVTIGQPHENAKFLDALANYKSKL